LANELNARGNKKSQKKEEEHGVDGASRRGRVKKAQSKRISNYIVCLLEII
jgi:hypothetical protein